MCHNLGVDPTLDQNVLGQELIGNYYQWGINIPVANGYTPPEAIAGWSNTTAPDGAWSETSKTATDPCPPGFKVPSKADWQAVVANNTSSRTGTFVDSPTNFGSAIHFSPDAVTKVLTLPASGNRISTNGSLLNRGIAGSYWTSSTQGTVGPISAHELAFTQSNIFVGGSNIGRNYGFPVRCIAQ